MQLKLDTVLLFVQNVDTVKHFYHKILGLPIMEEIPSEWVLLSADKAKIGLHKIGNNYIPAVSSESNSKIIFETDQDIYELHSILVAQGVSLNNITSFDHYPYLLFMGHDPEGNVFQIIQKK